MKMNPRRKSNQKRNRMRYKSNRSKLLSQNVNKVVEGDDEKDTNHEQLNNEEISYEAFLVNIETEASSKDDDDDDMPDLIDESDFLQGNSQNANISEEKLMSLVGTESVIKSVNDSNASKISGPEDPSYKKAEENKIEKIQPVKVPLNEENNDEKILNSETKKESKSRSLQRDGKTEELSSENPIEGISNENANEREDSSDDYDDMPELVDERFENLEITAMGTCQKQVKEEAMLDALRSSSPHYCPHEKPNETEVNRLELDGNQQLLKKGKGYQARAKAKRERPIPEKSLERKTVVTENPLELDEQKFKHRKASQQQEQEKETPIEGDRARAIVMPSAREKAQENDLNEKSAFIQNLQQQMEAMMAKGNDELPTTLMENLQKLFNQSPVSDIETSDEDDEYVEYVYKPRKYFLISLCNFCKMDLCLVQGTIPCSRCQLTYYCSKGHMRKDLDHRQLCNAIKKLREDYDDHHVFYKCGEFTPEQFRSFRLVVIRQLESHLDRPLSASEREVILFPRLCANNKCREYRFEKLQNCPKCGMIAYCKAKGEKGDDHSQANGGEAHRNWCQAYQLFKRFILNQEKFGRIEPTMPSKVLKEYPAMCLKTKDIFKKLNLDLPEDNCEYAALTQISTAPLTAWYALKACDKLRDETALTVHLIGAEIEFEVDLLHKWELFFLHITPKLEQLNVIFIGPELNPNNISFEQLTKTKCCRLCRKSKRCVSYKFITKLYHDYYEMEEFLRPNLICFFNAGLYRSFGYNMEDTWPATISVACRLNVPVVVSAYTEYEMPLDMQRFVQESNRHLNVTMPPHMNPFKSMKPERNFISDDVSPLMFKNYYCFIVE